MCQNDRTGESFQMVRHLNRSDTMIWWCLQGFSAEKDQKTANFWCDETLRHPRPTENAGDPRENCSPGVLQDLAGQEKPGMVVWRTDQTGEFRPTSKQYQSMYLFLYDVIFLHSVIT